MADAKDYFGVVKCDEFYDLKLGDVPWPPSNQAKKFYYLIRDLAMRGPMTISAMTRMFEDASHDYKNAYFIIYKLLYGTKLSTKNGGGTDGLIAMGFVVKDGKKFKLSRVGVMYFIGTFSEAFMKLDDFGIDAKNDDPDDLSYQQYTLRDISSITKNYADYFPALFENIEILKQSKYFDMYYIFNTIKGNNIFVHMIEPLLDDHSTTTINMLTGMFGDKLIENIGDDKYKEYEKEAIKNMESNLDTLFPLIVFMSYITDRYSDTSLMEFNGRYNIQQQMNVIQDKYEDDLPDSIKEFVKTELKKITTTKHNELHMIEEMQKLA